MWRTIGREGIVNSGHSNKCCGSIRVGCLAALMSLVTIFSMFGFYKSIGEDMRFGKSSINLARLRDERELLFGYQSSIDTCTQLMNVYNVSVGISWGHMTPEIQQLWESRNCNQYIVEPSCCCPSAPKAVGDPLIAILTGVSTRGSPNVTSILELALVKHLLPSLVRTVECGFRYALFVGYDKGDTFYDSERGVAQTRLLFQTYVRRPLSRVNVPIDLLLVAVDNPMQKPGPVFLEVARAAQIAGADFFFRLNDDSELLHPWAYHFTRTLQGMGPPYGVVGPYSGQNTVTILNHDFTHRTHMEIFDGDYYPTQLSDWWMDNWISMVYGSDRTRQAASIEIHHHTSTHGRRYEVNMKHELLLQGLVEEGKAKIVQWMVSRGLNIEVIQSFNSSRFNGYPFQDL